MNIPNHLQQIGFGINEDGLVTPSEQRPISLTSAVEALRIHPVYVSHHAREIPQGRLKQDVIVIWHAAVGEDLHLPPLDDVGQQLKESAMVV